MDYVLIVFYLLPTDKLEEKKQEEQDSQYFTPMPSHHYMEITLLLLQKYGTSNL
jgi:hypothetical protein